MTDYAVAIARFREMVEPLLKGKSVTQDDLARRLSELAGRPIAQTTVSRWLDGSDPRHAHTRNAVAALVAEMEAGQWPAAGSSGADEKTAAPEPNGDGGYLDRWGFQRAKAIADLAELLREDTPILSMRAETALNASKAMLLEAQKAPDVTGGISSEVLAKAVAALQTWELWWRSQGGGGGPPIEGPGAGDRPLPGG